MDGPSWTRVDVSEWSIYRVEQAGSSENRWLIEPGTDELWLHKDTHIPSNGQEQGEDWSEFVATQVAKTLAIPCAETRLCSRGGRRGSLSLSVLAQADVRPFALNEGRVVLERSKAPGYVRHLEGKPAHDPHRPDVKRPGHSLQNIKAALEGTGPPTTFAGPQGCDGFDVFAGYLVLDALIANSDRHEQNWAVLTPQLLGPIERLAPSYDHASSLGYNLTDQKRESLLADRASGLDRWSERGRARRYEHRGTPLTLVEHAAEAVALCSPDGRLWWTQVLERGDLGGPHEVLAEPILGMSEHASRFASELLELNLRRLRDVICSNA